MFCFDMIDFDYDLFVWDNVKLTDQSVQIDESSMCVLVREISISLVGIVYVCVSGRIHRKMEGMTRWQ